jgi:hypothetical protein
MIKFVLTISFRTCFRKLATPSHGQSTLLTMAVTLAHMVVITMPIMTVAASTLMMTTALVMIMTVGTATMMTATIMVVLTTVPMEAAEMWRSGALS